MAKVLQEFAYGMSDDLKYFVSAMAKVWAQAPQLLWAMAKVWAQPPQLLWPMAHLLLWTMAYLLLWTQPPQLLWPMAHLLLWPMAHLLLWPMAHLLLWTMAHLLLWAQDQLLLWPMAQVLRSALHPAHPQLRRPLSSAHLLPSLLRHDLQPGRLRSSPHPGLRFYFRATVSRR